MNEIGNAAFTSTIEEPVGRKRAVFLVASILPTRYIIVSLPNVVPTTIALPTRRWQDSGSIYINIYIYLRSLYCRRTAGLLHYFLFAWKLMKASLEASTAPTEASMASMEAMEAVEASVDAFMEDMKASTHKKKRKLPRKLSRKLPRK